MGSRVPGRACAPRPDAAAGARRGAAIPRSGRGSGRLRHGRNAQPRDDRAGRGADRRHGGRGRRGDGRLHAGRLGHQRGPEPRECAGAGRPVGHRPRGLRRQRRADDRARPRSGREPSEPLRRLRVHQLIRERERPAGDHRRHVRAARGRRPSRSRRRRDGRGGHLARIARGPGAARGLAADQRGRRTDRRAVGPARNAWLGMVEVATRGRRPRARRLAVGPDGRPARGDDTRARDRHQAGAGGPAHDQHDPRRARRQRPDQLREPRPRVGGQVRRRPRSADRPGDRRPSRWRPPPAGRPAGGGVGEGPVVLPARTGASPAALCGT